MGFTPHNGPVVLYTIRPQVRRLQFRVRRWRRHKLRIHSLPSCEGAKAQSLRCDSFSVQTHYSLGFELIFYLYYEAIRVLV